MCHTRRPSPGNAASNPFRWRFSTRKYSGPSAPSVQSRYTVWLSFTSAMDRSPGSVTFLTETQPWLTLHHADG